LLGSHGAALIGIVYVGLTVVRLGLLGYPTAVVRRVHRVIVHPVQRHTVLETARERPLLEGEEAVVVLLVGFGRAPPFGADLYASAPVVRVVLARLADGTMTHALPYLIEGLVRVLLRHL
jgi:hypothetical protein